MKPITRIPWLVLAPLLLCPGSSRAQVAPTAEAASTVEGVVVNAATGQPVAGAIHNTIHRLPAE